MLPQLIVKPFTSFACFLQILLFCSFLVNPTELQAQIEFTTWGNITGIRVDGELQKFNTSLFIADTVWDEMRETRKESQKIDFKRQNESKIFTFEMDSLQFAQSLKTVGRNAGSVQLTVAALHDTTVAGVFMRIDLPAQSYPDPTAQAIDPSPKNLIPYHSGGNHIALRTVARGLQIESIDHSLTINLKKKTDIIVKKHPTVMPTNEESEQQVVSIFIQLAAGELKRDDHFTQEITFNVQGKINRNPVSMTLFPNLKGNEFNGIGGNFRLQNPETDPQVIHYVLNNMRVAEGRVQMLWNYWNRNQSDNPYQKAKQGDLHPRVVNSMEMAQRLEKMGMPLYVAIWFPPDWAIVEDEKSEVNRFSDNLMGNRLDSTKMDVIYESITSYLLFMKEEFGVTTEYFSFNESDLGIDVRQTAHEHLQLIKELGKNFRENGLNTKILLGDNSDLNTWEFTLPASKDPAARKFMGPVSFHSWRGYTEKNLYQWYDLANRVNRPLVVGEGSIDAGAWRYPQIFQEENYAREEINTYIKILRIAQVRTLLQWQLTADYSLMAGGGIFGNKEDPLHPTQRFFNLKQLAETPENLSYIPVKTDGAYLNSVALVDSVEQTAAIHIVNNGAKRPITISQIPVDINQFSHYVTNNSQDMQQMNPVTVSDNKIELLLEADSFITLISR